jgi:hypothetical protein
MLSAIFTLINFVGAYAISRVLEKWRSDHAAAKADAEAGHHARASASLLRTSRGAQKSNFGDGILCGGDRDVEQGPMCRPDANCNV